jgi:hypothetical protein
MQFNKFIDEQKAIGDANITIVWFDNNWDVDYEGDLDSAKHLDSWKTGGMTALYDAIGKTFNHVKDRFSEESPEKVVLAIQTDGMENASKEFSQSVVADLIKEHEEKYSWDVIFLGAGLDSAKQAQALNIRGSNTFAYDVNDTKAAFSDVYSTAVGAART